jgi:CYTH domain-containing protein
MTHISHIARQIEREFLIANAAWHTALQDDAATPRLRFCEYSTTTAVTRHSAGSSAASQLVTQHTAQADRLRR